jgi:hypothetical protein
MPALNSLRAYLRNKMDMDRKGGVLFQRDDSTLILADMSVMSSAQLKLIESTFPHVSYTVMSCETSLSGFIVVFTCEIECDRQWQRSLLRLLLHALCFACTMHGTLP